MALSLRAEQKSIYSIYTSGDDVYVIPNYQRPYSWGRDVCYQLYSDITDAFLKNEDYFVGNIVMARGLDDKKRPNIVDGQQRLITLWLFLKVLTLLHPDKSRLRRTLEAESLLNDNNEPRICSLVFEHEDQKNIQSVLKNNLAEFKVQYNTHADSKGNMRKGQISRIESNALYIFKWLSDFYMNLSETSRKEQFLSYFLERVYLLPIELEGETLHEADSKALTIFETINNRGQSLEDSDIFKARLYEQAQKAHKEKEFISKWVEFTESCQQLNMTVDDLFRYYYHILRGKDGQTTNESGLREYFTGTGNSALSIRSYDEIIDDLNIIIYYITWIGAQKQELSPYAKWIQLIDLYTNQYPKYALINYLYYYGEEDRQTLESFIVMLVKYFYYRGATLQVKYETYRINKVVANDLKVPFYDCSDFDDSGLERIGYLRNGYALLAHYLLYPNAYIENVSFDRLIYEREYLQLPPEWLNVNMDMVINNIANIVVLDIPKQSCKLLSDKADYYSKSQLEDVKSLFNRTGTVSLSEFRYREGVLKKTLLNFFSQSKL